MIVPRETLNRVLSLTAGVAGASSKPVLGCVLFSGGTVTATDLEIRVSVAVPEADGPPVLLRHDRLSAIVREARGADEVEIDAGKTTATVRAGRGSWTLQTEDPTEFPSANFVDAVPLADVSALQWVALARQTVPATDTESSRYALGGVLLERGGGELAAVATDGRRLVALRWPADGEATSAILPARAVTVISRAAAAEVGGTVCLTRTPAEVIAVAGDVTVRARLVDGRFPKWRDVFPKRQGKTYQVTPAKLLAAVRQASIVTSETSKAATFAFGDCLRLSSVSAEYGEASIECDLLAPGEVTSVRLDPQFVASLAKTLDDTVPIEIVVGNADTAVVFRSGPTTAVIMPMGGE
jgi:DNA polymerase-3 subunit beta